MLDGDAGAIVAAVERYNDAEHAIRERVSPKGTRRLDLKDYVGDVVATPVEGGSSSRASPSATAATAPPGHRN